MGQTALLDAFAQSDLDMKGFEILNCPSIGGGGSGPNPFPAVANQFLSSYAPPNFGARRPVLVDLSNWPSPVGNAGKFLEVVSAGTTPDVAVYGWASPQGTSQNQSFLNVRQAPYNADGTGATDAKPAIQQAINDAQSAGGLGVYIPAGTYLLNSALSVPANSNLQGDSPWVSVLKLGVGVTGAMLIGATSRIRRIGVDGGLSRITQGAVTAVIGFGMQNGGDIGLFECIAYNCPSHGILASNCFALTISDCYVFGCGGYGIYVYNSGRTLVSNNFVSGCVLSGIWVVNSPRCIVNNNMVQSCGVLGYGVGLFDSDNTVVEGNTLQQNAIGLVASITPSRAIVPTDISYGYVFSGNNVVRDYYGGALMSLCNGFNFSGNIVAENGQGGVGNNVWTAEPGVVIDEGFKGSGYLAGDVLTLDVMGGSVDIQPQVVVLRVNSGVITSDGLGIVRVGSFTTFPNGGVNPLTTTCSRNPSGGARVILTATKIGTGAGGSGYAVGMILRATNGTFYNPVRVQVTAIGGASGSAVTGYSIMDGGGYTGTPPANLTFQLDGLSAPDSPPNTGAGPISPPVPDPTGGFTLDVMWGLRYSQTGKFGGGLTFGLGTYGHVQYGVVNGNVIQGTLSGTGILIADEASGSYQTRADWLTVVGNSLVKNAFAARGATHNVPDANYIFNSLFASNLMSAGSVFE